MLGLILAPAGLRETRRNFVNFVKGARERIILNLASLPLVSDVRKRLAFLVGAAGSGGNGAYEHDPRVPASLYTLYL